MLHNSTLDSRPSPPLSPLVSLLSSLLLLALLAAPAHGQATDSTLAVGSKKFTENVLLGWMGTHLMRADRKSVV